MPEPKPIERTLSTPKTLCCEEWESLIPEALDGTLPAADLAAFEQHSRQCAACARMLEEARQGVQWLGFLEREPEAPSGLLQKILARTSGEAPSASIDPDPAWRFIPGAWVPAQYRAATLSAGRLRHLVAPRLWMTAAMAFFSLALTLNLTGVNPSKIYRSGVDLSVLRPSALRTRVTRQYYSANAQVVKYYENLRFVYDMEARMRDLQGSAEPQPEPVEAPDPSTNHPASHPSTSHSPATKNSGTDLGQEATESVASLSDRLQGVRAQGVRAQAKRNLA